MSIKYFNIELTFDIDEQILYIKLETNYKTIFDFGDSWDSTNKLKNDIQIIKKDKYFIEYKFIKRKQNNIELFTSNHLQSHVIFDKNKYSFTGQNAIMIPFSIYNKNQKGNEKHTTANISYYKILNGEKLKDNDVYCSIKNNLLSENWKNALIIRNDNNVINHKYFTLSLFNTNKFYKKRDLITDLVYFINKCNKLFNKKYKFLINYKEYIDKNDHGYGGNATKLGFDYFVIQTNKSYSKEQYKKYRLVLLHELFHSYNITQNDSKHRDTIFTEGFTEFFAVLLGSKNNKEFNKYVKEFYSKYNNNKYKNMKLDDYNRQLAWDGEDGEKLPYHKGFIYAYYLYNKYGKIDFINKFKKLVKYNKNNPNVLEYFNDIFKDENYEKYVINGDSIDIKI